MKKVLIGGLLLWYCRKWVEISFPVVVLTRTTASLPQFTKLLRINLILELSSSSVQSVPFPDPFYLSQDIPLQWRQCLLLSRSSVLAVWYKQGINIGVDLFVKIRQHHANPILWKRFRQACHRKFRLQLRTILVHPRYPYVHPLGRILQGSPVSRSLPAKGTCYEDERKFGTEVVRLVETKVSGQRPC